jgi:hypothetical protein
VERVGAARGIHFALLVMTAPVVACFRSSMPGQVPALPTLRTLSREVSPVRRLRASGRAFACPTGAPGRGPAASAVPSAHTASWRQNFLGAGGRCGSSGGRDPSNPDWNRAPVVLTGKVTSPPMDAAAARASDPPSDVRYREITRCAAWPAVCAVPALIAGPNAAPGASRRSRGNRTTRPRGRTRIEASCSDQRRAVFSSTWRRPATCRAVR